MATFVRTQEVAHEIGERGRFALRVTSPDVQMRADDGTVARVRISFEIRATTDAEADEIFDRLRFRVTEGNGALEVAEPRHGSGAGLGSLVRLFGMGSGQVDTNVEVDAPRLSDMRFDGVSADLTAIGFRGLQEYRTVSGDLVLDGTGGEVRIKGVSSDISLRAEAPLRSLDINTVSGDISAFAPRIEQLRAATVSGDVELEGHPGGRAGAPHRDGQRRRVARRRRRHDPRGPRPLDRCRRQAPPSQRGHARSTALRHRQRGRAAPVQLDVRRHRDSTSASHRRHTTATTGGASPTNSAATTVDRR